MSKYNFNKDDRQEGCNYMLAHLDSIEVDGFLCLSPCRAVCCSGIGVRQLGDQDSLFVVSG